MDRRQEFRSEGSRVARPPLLDGPARRSHRRAAWAPARARDGRRSRAMGDTLAEGRSRARRDRRSPVHGVSERGPGAIVRPDPGSDGHLGGHLRPSAGRMDHLCMAGPDRVVASRLLLPASRLSTRSLMAQRGPANPTAARVTRRAPLPAPRWQTPLPRTVVGSWGPDVDGLRRGRARDPARSLATPGDQPRARVRCKDGRLVHRHYLVSAGRQNGKTVGVRSLVGWALTAAGDAGLGAHPRPRARSDASARPVHRRARRSRADPQRSRGSASR
jgi:hypothetical protein